MIFKRAGGESRVLGGWCLGLLAVAACGGRAANSPDVGAAGASVEETGAGAGGQTADGGAFETAPPRLGWSVRDATPYSRTGHALVLDEANDRLILFGGGGVDVWALPLSGARANHWQQIFAEGNETPAGGTTQTAVYDPEGQRMLVLSSDDSNYGSTLFALSLGDTPTWSVLAGRGRQPGEEIHGASLVLDQTGKRLIFVGAGPGKTGTWALGLDSDPVWSRLVDSPDTKLFGGTAVLDAARQRVLFFQAPTAGPSQVWEMPLAGGDWRLVDELTCGASWKGSVTFDPEGEQAIFMASACGINTYSVADPLQSRQREQPDFYSFGPGVLDTKRGRVLYFSGGLLASATEYGKLIGNGVAALSLTNLKLTTLVDDTLGQTSGEVAVWDSKRKAVIAFGGYGIDNTTTRMRVANGSWEILDSEQAPPGKAAYDPVSGCIFGFGDQRNSASKAQRLCPGGHWESLTTEGPEHGRGNGLIIDTARRRMIVHSGEIDAGYPDARAPDETWALSLDGEPSWSKLETHGDSPGGRSGEAAIYDAAQQRMIVYGGLRGNDVESDGPGDLHALDLESLQWRSLDATGTRPQHARVAAMFDAEQRRLIVLDRGVSGFEPADVYALDLSGAPTWHHYCSLGTGLPGYSLVGSDTVQQPVLVPDGLFVGVRDGAFRFDLNTPYCD